MTVAATLATAPLMAHHFGTLVGRGAAREPARAARRRAGDVAGDARRDGRPAPRRPGRAAQLARLALPRLHRPGRALVRRPGLGAARAAARRAAAAWRCAYAACSPALGRSWRWRPPRRRAGLRPARPAAPPQAARRRRRRPLLALLRRARAASARRGPAAAAPDALGVRVLDVGQGDAILLDPPGGDRRSWSTPARPGPGWRTRLRELGVERARRRSSSPTTSPTTPAALAEVLARSPAAGGCSAAARARSSRRGARRAGAGLRAARRGRRAALGRAAARASLWPPRELAGPRPGGGPQPALARPARRVAPLLDAAHRRRRGRGGPARSGAGRRAQGRPPRQRRRGPRRRCCERTAPQLAVISVGEDNPYGHPAPETLRRPALAAGSPVAAHRRRRRDRLDRGRRRGLAAVRPRASCAPRH